MYKRTSQPLKVVMHAKDQFHYNIGQKQYKIRSDSNSG